MDLQDFCKRWLQAWTGNRPELVWSFYTDDAYYQDVGRAQGLRGADVLAYFRKLLAKNPDWVWEPIEILQTQKGFCLKWKAAIPTPRGVAHVIGLDIVELRDGRICRNEVYFDPTPLMG